MISIIIPTLNEEHYLEHTILLAKKNAQRSIEIIVIDAGSHDQTRQVAINLGVDVHHQPSFIHKKFLSLNYGLGKAKGEIVLFLDADTLLPPNFDQAIYELMKDRFIIGGAFDFSFDSELIKYKVLGFLNRMRLKVELVYNGDHAIFCRKDVALKMGGYPEKHLMEASYFCNLLQAHGKLKLLKIQTATSTRRFENNGFWKVLSFDIIMWCRFKLGLEVDQFGIQYWSSK